MPKSVTDALLSVGWHVGRRASITSGPLTWKIMGELVARSGRAPMDHWRHSVETMTGRAVRPSQVRGAVASYVRYWMEMITLPGMSTRDIDRAVYMSPTDMAALQHSVWTRGCVLALGHQANWDLAGAWAVQHQMPVSTVAEVLPGSAFERFVAYRRSLGFEVFGHTDPRAVRALVDSAKRHRLVCLLADRNLTGAGQQVQWHCAGGPRTVRVPAGPAYIAERAGADLRVLTMRYTGHQLHLTVSPIISPGSVAERTQRIVDILSRDIAAHPRDWHVLQPFFGQESGCA